MLIIYISRTWAVCIQVNLPPAAHFNDDLSDIIGGVPVAQGSFGGIITKSYESSEQMIGLETLNISTL
jgi:hypothetical protein